MLGMRVLILRCGEAAAELVLPKTLYRSSGVEIFTLPAVPGRGDLKFLSEHATELLPVDPTPSLEEIQAQPRVEHMAAPQLAPQQPVMPLRIIVIGSDAALSAVLTRLLRADQLWPQIGFVPVAEPTNSAVGTTGSTKVSGPATDDAVSSAASTAAQNWSIPTDPAAALKLALTGEVKPVPLIRNDAGQAVAGSAAISQWDASAMTGEIIVDDATLLQQDARGTADNAGRSLAYGARLVPMLNAPGIAAAVHTAAPQPRGLFARWRKKKHPGSSVSQLDPHSLVTGRAVQAGGPEMAVDVDGVRSKRPQKRVTFYRHLRDLQIIRP